MKDCVSCFVPRAVCAAGVVLFGFGSVWADIPASAYVQDGLIAQWDGIENAGLGQPHNPNAAYPQELVSGIAQTLTGTMAAGDNYFTLGAGYTTFKLPAMFAAINAGHATVEMYAGRNGTVAMVNNAGFVALGKSSRAFWAYQYNNYFIIASSFHAKASGEYQNLNFNDAGENTVSFLMGDSTATSEWRVNGISKGTLDRKATDASENDDCYLGFIPGYDKARARMYSLRFYNRKLSAAEVSINANIDKLRFGGVDPEKLGYRWNSTAGKLEVRVRVSADGEGTVAVDAAPSVAAGDSWKAVGSQVTLTPNPAEGFVFYRWSGDTHGLTVGANGVATFVADGPRELSCYFRPEGTVGELRTWTGETGDGQWFTAGNWDPAGVPAVGDEVLIESGTVSLTNATAALLSCTLSGASARMLFAEPVRCAPEDLVTTLNAQYVTLEGGATMSHVTNLQTMAEFKAMENPTWLMDGRVSINCRTLDIDAASKIDVGGHGYFVKPGTKIPAPGPGGDNGVASSTDVVPSYGGWSGYTARFVTAGATKWKSMPYGSAEAPVYPGTAGGFGNGNNDAGSPGGGAVRIVASGRVTIDGKILANGGYEGSSGAIGNSRKSGTGGAVWITCRTVAGSGTIEANSGSVDLSSSLIGSGGRIALVYDRAAQNAADAVSGVPALHFSARSLPVNPATPKARSIGKPGTVYFPDTRFLGTTFSAARGVQFGEIKCGDWSGWNPTESLTLDNAVIVFREGPALSLSLSGALTIAGAYSELDIGGGGGILMNNKSSLAAGVPRMWSAAPLALSFGSISLGEKSFLEIYAGPTNETTAARTEVTVAGALDLAANSQMILTCHPTNAAIVRVSAGSLNVAAGATVTSDSWGWSGAQYGMGPGAPTAYGNAGASYGGAAHAIDAKGAWCGHPYGEPSEPIHPGSGGASSGSGGGGVVWLNIAGDAVVNGTLTAVGQSQLGGSTGSGSGGSVYLQCRTLSGSGLLNAKGGYGQFKDRAGAGGRIAVKYDAVAQAEVGLPNIRYTTQVTTADGARVLPDYGTVYFTDATLLGDSFTVARGVQYGSVYLGSGWEKWRPQGVVVSNAWARLVCGSTPLTIDGDLMVTGDSEFGFGGGDYAYTNSVRRYAFTKGVGPQVRITGSVIVTNVATSTDAKRAELWMLAGDPCGTDRRSGVSYGGLLEVDRTLSVCAANAQFRTMCHPNDGWGVKVVAKNVSVENGGTINAVGCGYQGTTASGMNGGGPGGGRGSGSGGSYGGVGGAANAASQGPSYGNAKLPVQCGSGAGWYSAQGGSQYSGAGGGLVWLEVLRKVHVDGTINANGANSSADHNGGGSGGGIFICCETWSVGPNAQLTANGGNGGTTHSGYGGGGGRIAIWRSVDEDPTPLEDRDYLSVAFGKSIPSSSFMPKEGTIRWRRRPDGLMLFVR